MTTLISRKYVFILIHVLGWALLGFLLMVYQPLTFGVELPWQFWIKQALQLAGVITLFYLNAFVVVPRLLVRQRGLFFLLWIVCASAAAMLVGSAVDIALNLRPIMHQIIGERAWNRTDLNIYILTMSLLVLGFSTGIAAVQTIQKDVARRQKQEDEQVRSELTFLKAQINPHFFFNTLNTIYALTFVNVETSREALHKLSRMMRYLLYETEQDQTMLSQEILFLRDYIELMQLRLTEKTTVVFETPAQLKDVPIAPMLLLPFVENAFKHGVSATKTGEIGVYIRQEENKLQLDVKNPACQKNANPMPDNNSGIGLNNTRRRLQLMYPGKHALQTGPQEAVYTVHLELDLS